MDIALLQRAYLLASDVLAAKDVGRAISDSAIWRSDQRGWGREGTPPRPGRWNDPGDKP